MSAKYVKAFIYKGCRWSPTFKQPRLYIWMA